MEHIWPIWDICRVTSGYEKILTHIFLVKRNGPHKNSILAHPIDDIISQSASTPGFNLRGADNTKSSHLILDLLNTTSILLKTKFLP